MKLGARRSQVRHSLYFFPTSTWYSWVRRFFHKMHYWSITYLRICAISFAQMKLKDFCANIYEQYIMSDYSCNLKKLTIWHSCPPLLWLASCAEVYHLNFSLICYTTFYDPFHVNNLVRFNIINIFIIPLSMTERLTTFLFDGAFKQKKKIKPLKFIKL